MSAVLFCVLAAVAIAAALLVVLHPSPVYSALGLVGTLFVVAVLFLTLDAHLVGWLQVIVYAGAIVVLFLFVINLLNLQAEPRAMADPGAVAVAAVGAIAFAATLIAALGAGEPPPAQPLPAGFGTTEFLAARLFSAHLVSFELTSVLLLVAIVGAVVLAKRRPSA